ncbi:hypothetical protein ACJX0J_039038 [Zea mays]
MSLINIHITFHITQDIEHAHESWGLRQSLVVLLKIEGTLRIFKHISCAVNELSCAYDYLTMLIDSSFVLLCHMEYIWIQAFILWMRKRILKIQASLTTKTFEGLSYAQNHETKYCVQYLEVSQKRHIIFLQISRSIFGTHTIDFVGPTFSYLLQVHCIERGLLAACLESCNQGQ